MSPKEILKSYWGYDAFRPMQEEIIGSVLEGHDTLALLPTGGGKSVCFQVPALAKEGICLVITPLISLMKDQLETLRRRRVKARCLHGGLKPYERDVLLNQCVFGNVKFLYLSPEMLRSETFIGHYRKMNVNLIAVDEAHCISQWGYDFRPPYLQIGEIRKYHPHAPVLALTATATEQVAKDIQEKLLFRNGRLFKGNFARPNLAYTALKEEDKAGRLLRIIRKVGGSGIVYVRNRKRTAAVAAQLNEAGIAAVAYHAGLDTPVRNERQRLWMEGAVQVMVATNAFGMGIDKPDVRYVVHLDIPGTPEAYFQEAGRAGRDGKKSYPVLLFDDADLGKQERQTELSFPDLKYIRSVYNAVCNYYQIPTGSGEGLRFPFNLEDFCRTYNLSVYTCYTALNILCREGLIDIPTREDSVSRLFIRVGREDFYRFQISHRQYDRLFSALLRLFGGLFTEYTNIQEGKVARQLGMKEEEVCLMLRQLDRMEVVSYDEKIVGPRLIFLSPRMDPSHLALTETDYKAQQQRAKERAAAMRNYVLNGEMCRSQQLLAYFGERTTAPCGVCDVCLAQRNAERLATAYDQIAATLKQAPCNIKQLAEKLPLVSESALIYGVRHLLDEGKITMDKEGVLAIP
ncbi:MAG: ATP-dependent DNA helicase RecQ [Bacteroidales bacterium]|nr:ATP-dependent DNA helicase RecQ [Bacteroidales bacterium]